MNWLTVIVLIMFAYNVIWGKRNGFIKTAFSIVSIVLSIILTSLLAPYIASAINSNEGIYKGIYEKVEKFVFKEDKEIKDDEQEDFIDELFISRDMKQYLLENNTANTYKERALNSFNEYIIDGLTRIVVNILSYIIMYIVVSICIGIIAGLLDLISKLPIIEEFNGIGGILIGAIKGLIEIWILLLVITLIASTPIGKSAMECINSSFILDMLYSNNILMQIIYSYVG